MLKVHALRSLQQLSYKLVKPNHLTYRLLSTEADAEATEEAKSKRRIFNAIKPDMKILNHLDSINLGILAKRSNRVAVAKRLNPHDDRNRSRGYEGPDKSAPPFPFRSTGKVIHESADYNEIPPCFVGSPPEIAIIGRSNVGKSTLLNALVGFDSSYVQKAIVSDKPGETKYLKFYQMGSTYRFAPRPDVSSETTAGQKKSSALQPEQPPQSVKSPALFLVDMPGYGFAFMNEEEKLRCHLLCLDYLISNPRRDKVIKRVILLLDGRHGLKSTDVQFLRDLQQHLIDSEKSIVASEGIKNAASSINVASNFDSNLDAKTIKSLSKKLGWKLQIILTKCDMLERNELCRRLQVVNQELDEKVPVVFRSMLPIMALSAKQNRGVRELQRELAGMVAPRRGADGLLTSLGKGPPVASNSSVVAVSGKQQQSRNQMKHGTASAAIGSKSKMTSNDDDDDDEADYKNKKSRSTKIKGNSKSANAVLSSSSASNKTDKDYEQRGGKFRTSQDTTEDGDENIHYNNNKQLRARAAYELSNQRHRKGHSGAYRDEDLTDDYFDAEEYDFDLDDPEDEVNKRISDGDDDTNRRGRRNKKGGGGVKLRSVVRYPRRSVDSITNAPDYVKKGKPAVVAVAGNRYERRKREGISRNNSNSNTGDSRSKERDYSNRIADVKADYKAMNSSSKNSNNIRTVKGDQSNNNKKKSPTKNSMDVNSDRNKSKGVTHHIEDDRYTSKRTHPKSVVSEVDSFNPVAAGIVADISLKERIRMFDEKIAYVKKNNKEGGKATASYDSSNSDFTNMSILDRKAIKMAAAAKEAAAVNSSGGGGRKRSSYPVMRRRASKSTSSSSKK